MKVVHYHRHAKSGFHIHAFSSAEMFYVPDEDLILIREQHGSFGSRTRNTSRIWNRGFAQASQVNAQKPVERTEGEQK